MTNRVLFEERRDALKAIGSVGATLLVGCGGSGTTSEGSDGGLAGEDAASAAEASVVTDAGETADAGDDAMSPSTVDGGRCVLDPNLTKGPFWVDGQLERSDIRSDSTGQATPNPRPGLPMTLQLVVHGYAAGKCTPLEGAQVDIWHTDGMGIYSDVQSVAGEDFLRGWQVTDSKGAVKFTTIYPGWYPGRAVHIHVKVRLFDAKKNTTTEATTQIFFDDSITDKVFASNAPYAGRGTRSTLNAQDGYYGGHTELLVGLSGSPSKTYAATISLGVQVGTIATG